MISALYERVSFLVLSKKVGAYKTALREALYITLIMSHKMMVSLAKSQKSGIFDLDFRFFRYLRIS